MIKHVLFFYLMLTAYVSGCDNSNSNTNDTNHHSTDSHSETGTDSQTDTQTELETDSDSHTATDSDTIVIEEIPLWDRCPKALDFVGDTDWTWQLNASINALYCKDVIDIGFTLEVEDPTKNLKQELARKAQLRIVPGYYHLPSPNANAQEMYLPLCLKDATDVYASNIQSGTASHSSQNTTITDENSTEIQAFEHYIFHNQTAHNKTGESVEIQFNVNMLTLDDTQAGIASISGHWPLPSYELSLSNPIYAGAQINNEQFFPCHFDMSPVTVIHG